MLVKKQQLEPDIEVHWFKIGKGVHQGCILSLCLFNLHAEHIMRNAGLDESQARIKIAGRNINNLRYADDNTLMAESKEELKSLLMTVREESEKAGLKLNIQKTKIIVSGPIIEGGKVETVTDFIFLGSKITVNGDCSHEIKRYLLLWRKAITNLVRILKSRDITLPTKVRIDQAMVFPVVMYRCDSWSIKKAEHQRIGALLNCGAGEDSWESLGLQGDQTSQYYRKSTLNSHWKDWCWSWSSNTLATWREESTKWKRSWCWERLRARGEGGNRGWNGWRASPTQQTRVWANSWRQWKTRKPSVMQSIGSQRVGHDLAIEQFSIL